MTSAPQPLWAQSGTVAADWLRGPAFWAFLLLAIGVWLLLPRGRYSRWQQALGILLALISVGLFAAQLPLPSGSIESIIFWTIAAVTIVSAVAMISMHSPVYSAIWFAMTLLGTAGLMLLQGAQFLAVATIAVYAGAIVVTFLFLIMLAQPDGHEYFDRISWGSPAVMSSAAAGAVIVLVMTHLVAGIATSGQHADLQQVVDVLGEVVDDENQPVLAANDLRRVDVRRPQLGQPVVEIHLERADELSLVHRYHLQRRLGETLFGRELADQQLVLKYRRPGDVRSPQHVAGLGGELFSRHLLAVELAGTLLLVALVGAIAIVIRGREHETQDEDGGGPP